MKKFIIEAKVPQKITIAMELEENSAELVEWIAKGDMPYEDWLTVQDTYTIIRKEIISQINIFKPEIINVTEI